MLYFSPSQNVLVLLRSLSSRTNSPITFYLHERTKLDNRNDTVLYVLILLLQYAWNISNDHFFLTVRLLEKEILLHQKTKECIDIYVYNIIHKSFKSFVNVRKYESPEVIHKKGKLLSCNY